MGVIKRKYQDDKMLSFVSINVWLIFTVFCTWSIVNDAQLVYPIFGLNIIAILFLLLILAALYGYLISMITFSICFITCLIFKTDQAYILSIFLNAMFCISLFSQYFWFKKIWKTIVVSIVTSIVAAFMAMLCFITVEQRKHGMNALRHFCDYFWGVFVVTFLACAILYVYFKFAPDKFKRFFPLAFGYTDEYQKNQAFHRYQRKTKVSLKITAIIIVVELILCISVAGFFVILFPDIKEMLLNAMGNINVPMTEAERNSFVQYMEEVNYSVNDFAISFDIKMSMLIFCVGVPLAAIANYYTKTRIGAPLGIMSDFMHTFVLTKDEDKMRVVREVNNIKIKTGDEIEVLGDYAKSTLLEMADYIERIQDKQKLENELVVAKQASEAKSSFLSNMSHEIRTPINAIIGMNEMILREAEDEQILEYANNVKSAGDSLLSLVNDILDFSKIEAGKMEILPVQYDLSSMINDLVNLITARAQEKGLELEVNVDSNIPSNLYGDEIRLKQVVTNLLTNAVKYTEEGKVALSVSYMKVDEKTIKIHFEVSDTGIGIKKEDLEKLYSPFERIEEIRNRTIEGTGLGMSIVKKLLALMDTKLMVESDYGVGSSFRFSVLQGVVTWDAIGDFKSKYKEYLSTATKYHQRFQAPDAKILVVDDTEMNLTVIKSLLKKTLVQVETATSGFETLDLVKEKKYDIIFLDHRMPEMDGIETFEAMKKLSGNLNHETPVIALTANAVSGAKREYMAHGFNDYLAKPVNATELEEMIEHYLPPEKIVSVSIFNANDDYKTAFDDELKIPSDSFLNKLKDVDLRVAVQNCGGAEVLESVVKDFLTSLDSKADAIEGFLKEEDLRNYTVLVHALKSSARLIGALELSDMARELEDLGNLGDIEAIRENTPLLLEKYRSYKQSLKAAVEEVDSDKPEISVEDLNRAFKDMKEVLEAYDFDTADSVMEMISGYSIPDEMKEKYNDVKQLMAAVDRDGLLEIL